MRFIIPLAMIAGLGATSFALAEAPTRELKADAQPRAMINAELTAQIDKLGYDVRRLKAEDQHYEALIVDRGSGGAVEATFDRTSGELLGAKLTSEDHRGRQHEEARERREPRKVEETSERADVKKDQDSRAHERRDADDDERAK
jgi:hypothetical protein